MVELRPRPREDFPGLVAVLAEEDQVVLSGRSPGRERLVLGPADTGDVPHAARAAAPKARASAHPVSCRIANASRAENVRVSRELQQRHRRVEVIKPQNGTCVVGSRLSVRQ